jgi:EAL domain-containing protein (putative c-di-GMP-specific phosphodiesterase class I)
MSLYKQLWLAIVFLLTLVFCVSVALSSVSAKRYLEQQLAIKNSDNAAALAISLTQQDADPVLMELTLAAQFDTGFYELIRLTGPEGEVLLERRDRSTGTRAPGWFTTLLPIEAAPGIATIQRGWTQAGTLELRSHSRFAYDELWQTTWTQALAFFLTALAAGAFGSLLLRRLLAPLAGVVGQASAIGERRFVTLQEPHTREFRDLVAAMNRLSTRVRDMLASEGERLEQLQRATTADPVTGLLDRSAFGAQLVGTLAGDDAGATGSFCIGRLGELARYNEAYGRQVMDAVLASAGRNLNALCRDQDWSCGRLNGSDIALLAPGAEDPRTVGAQLQDVLAAAFTAHDVQLPGIPVSCGEYQPGDRAGDLLTALDAALQAAEHGGTGEIALAQRGARTPVREQLERWRTTLSAAFAGDGFTLVTFPVLEHGGAVLHREALVRLREDGALLPAAQFLPWINRLQLAGELDRRVVELALRLTAECSEPLAVNLSTAALADDDFPGWLDRRAAATGTAGRLALEVAESTAYHHMPSFRRLCAVAHRHGIQTGMDKVGRRLADLGQLHDVGIDYVKLDAVFVRDIDSDATNQNLLRTLSTLVHAVGVTVIAEGVGNRAQWQALEALGVDAVGGPGVRQEAD